MIAPFPIFLLATAACISACPVKRQVEELNEEALAEAHQRDETATRAFSNTAIKVRNYVRRSCGKPIDSLCRLLMGSA